MIDDEKTGGKMPGDEDAAATEDPTATSDKTNQPEDDQAPLLLEDMPPQQRELHLRIQKRTHQKQPKVTKNIHQHIPKSIQ